MERLDEHEMMIEYSEMTSFDFDSKEFQEVRKDYMECKNFMTELAYTITQFLNKFRPITDY